jgi:hypothetical protein
MFHLLLEIKSGEITAMSILLPSDTKPFVYYQNKWTELINIMNFWSSSVKY